MNEIFNSSFETGLRILLLLSSIQPQTATIDRLAAYDFITIYGKDFDVSENNLHGDNNFNFSELATKRSNCGDGIKEFVLNGLISINRTEDGFAYFINQSGEKYVNSLSSEYASEYITVAKAVHKRFIDTPDEELIKFINQKAIKELRRKA